MSQFIIRDPSKLPFWTNTTIHTGPLSASTTLTTTERGYDIAATRLSDARRAAAYARANGTICDGHVRFPVFVHDFQLATQLSGTMAQSAQTRDFYPRNFVQPNYTIIGQSLDQQSYGTMCDFIRHIQYEGIRTNLDPNGKSSGLALGSGLVQFMLNGGGLEPSRTGGSGVRIRKSKLLGDVTRVNQIMKGQHQTLLMLGYFNTMPRQHEAHTYSPIWTAQFIVADMVWGPFSEDMVQTNKQQTWVDLLNSTKHIDYTPAQAAAKAKGDINFINKTSLNIVNTGS